MLESILDAVGHTPLVLLNRLTGGLQAKVAVKVEMTNPGGSVKDRVALAMIAEAELKGLLRAGGTIIEATAGNTGVGLAMVAAVKGYRCIFVLPDKMSAEKIALLKRTGRKSSSRKPLSRWIPEVTTVADRLSAKSALAAEPVHQSRTRDHYRTTGPKSGIRRREDHGLRRGVGTGGTVSGSVDT